MSAPALEYLPGTTREGLVCYLRHAPSGWVFRFLPWRDPDQPRFWCLRVDICTSASLAARTTDVDPFYVALGMTRDEAASTLARIQSDPMTWLGQAAQQAIRRWVAHVVRVPMPPPLTYPHRTAAARPGASDPKGAIRSPSTSPAGLLDKP